jgi:predicted MFS family arabinose efflux permease
MNTATRMVYPFLPALARGLGVTLAQASRLVALRGSVGLLSPLFAPLSERHGRRPVLLAALLLFSFSSFLVPLWSSYWAFGLALACVALAKVIFDPAMQAFIGDVVPYKQRGRVIAATEIAWALSLLLGAPLVGWLIERHGWQSPFTLLGILGLIVTAWTWRVMPGGRPHLAINVTMRGVFRAVRRHPQILQAGLYVMLAMGANDILFIVYGDWMESSFGLSLGALGLASAVIGGAEIAGEFTAGWAVDRFGKRPVVIAAATLAAVAYAGLPYLGTTLGAALRAIALAFFLFELAIVGGIPLLTELVPEARGLVMSAAVAGASLGRMAGSWVGPLIYARGGLRANGLVSAGIGILAVLVLARWLREDERAGELDSHV